MYTYNFYQSTLRKKINSELFAKPTFEFLFQNQSYQVICKEKKIFGIIVVRFQVLGVDNEVFTYREDFKNGLLQEAKNYYEETTFFPIYIQLGCTQVLLQYQVQDYKENSQLILEKFNEAYSQFIIQNIPIILKPSSKHNLPDATVVVDCTLPWEQIEGSISKNTKEKIKKAKKLVDKGGLDIQKTDLQEDYDSFYQLYAQTAETKGFGAVTKKMWKSLKDYLVSCEYGKLFLIKDKDNNLISGALCLRDDNRLIYLYGANDRRYGNAGLSQYLHSYIMQYTHENGIKSYDFLGVSRIGTSGDRLEKITQFKMGFGGEKVEYAGSWDLPLGKWRYWLYKKII